MRLMRRSLGAVKRLVVLPPAEVESANWLMTKPFALA